MRNESQISGTSPVKDKPQWSPPLSFHSNNENDITALRDLVGAERYRQLLRSPESIRHPLHDAGTEVRSPSELHVSYDGVFFHFPWSGDVVEYPTMEVFRRLRTDRNRDLITVEEQQNLFQSTIAVFGLSVGSSIVERLATGGIGGRFILADMDLIEPTNLNRISATFGQVGESKVDWLAKRISEIDPYIHQHHLPQGVSAQILLEELPTLPTPSVLVDEVDDLSVKFAIREYGRTNHIAVIMATDIGDTVILDVERHDQPNGAKIFGGRLKPKDLELLAAGQVPPDQLKHFMLRVLGVRHLSTRLINSGLDIGTRLSGMPQLGTTASMAGSVATVAIRELLLNHRMPSGRYAVSLRKSLNLQRSAPFRDGFRAVRRLVRTQ